MKPVPAPQPILTTAHGTLYHGDCLDLLASMEDDSIDLVFADPPFNLNKDYGPKVRDDLKAHEYVEWCAQWVKECARVVAPGGAIWIYNLPKWNIEIGHRLNEVGMLFRHWVAIDIKMVLPIQGRLYPSHYAALYYTKGKPKYFERPRIPIATCRHCGGDIKDYGGHRNKLNPEGINISDVWTDIPPVRHAKTKTRGANQLSEKLMERIIGISSGEGDLVFDPFGGSGTTYAVAERLHRRWVGIELGDCEPIVARLTGGDTTVVMPNRGDSAKRKRATPKEAPDHLFPW
jgi:site-specific DNA-methyltransferase (adenine-specific)